MHEVDPILSKISIIKNCLTTISKATGLNPDKLDDVIIQDAYVLNLQRAVQACIDIAHIIIAEKGYKLPASYKESFMILNRNKVISADLAEKISKMIGFRNIAVHDYQSLSPAILKSILVNNLKDFEEYYTAIYNYLDINT